MRANLVRDGALKSDGRSELGTVKVRLSRLSTEIGRRVHAGTPSLSVEFFRGVAREVSRIRGNSNIELRLECLWNAAHFLFMNGMAAEALDASRHLDDLLRGDSSALWQRKIHLLSGVIHADLGDIPEAVSRHTKALVISRDRGDLVGEAMSLINLGAALNYAGLYTEAIGCFKRTASLSNTDELRAAELDEGRAENTFQCVALTNLAQSYLYVDQPELAYRAIKHCLSLSAAPKDAISAWSRVIREFTYVRAALAVGDIQDARQHSSLCRMHSADGNGRGEILALICEGLCEVSSGSVHDGLSKLEQALHRSESMGSARLTALMALAQASDSIDQPTVALDYIDKVLAQIRRHRGEGIATLLADARGENNQSADTDDLASFKIRRANLRARIAERAATDAHIEMLERLALAAELREEASGGHGFRVGKLSALLAAKLDWNRDACYSIELAGRLHDIGKIGMPDRILLKSEALKLAERRFVSGHAEAGAEILAQGRFTGLKIARQVALFHHEKWDGNGYPSGISGNRIPMSARIVSIVDVFDALTHGRPYAPTLSVDKALEEVMAGSGTAFDPALTTAFVALVNEIASRASDLDSYLGTSQSNSSFKEARNRLKELLAPLPLDV